MCRASAAAANWASDGSMCGRSWERSAMPSRSKNCAPGMRGEVVNSWRVAALGLIEGRYQEASRIRTAEKLSFSHAALTTEGKGEVDVVEAFATVVDVMMEQRKDLLLSVTAAGWDIF